MWGLGPPCANKYLKKIIQAGPSLYLIKYGTLSVKTRESVQKYCTVLYGERKSLAWPAGLVLCRCLSHAAEGNNTGDSSIFLYELMEDKKSTPVP
jgi:hypothetical protein